MNLNYNSHYLTNKPDLYPTEENPNLINFPYLKRMFAGRNQQERMIADKAKTLARALKYSYQAADIQKE